MKFKKKTIIITALIVVLWTYFYIQNKSKEAKIAEENKAKLVYTVSKWDIRNEVKVTATAKLVNEQKLSFGQEWKITKVYVKVWDEVKAGSVLAELKMDDYQNAINSSLLELENTKLWLTKLLNNDISLKVSQLNSQINEKKANYNIEVEQEKILEKQLNTQLNDKKTQLDQLSRDYEVAKKNLEIAKSSLEISTKTETEQTENTLTARSQTIKSIISSLNSTLWDIEQIVKSVDKIYWVSDEYKDASDDYNIYLWAKNINLKNETLKNISDSYNLIQKYKTQINAINTEMSDSEIYNLIQKYYEDTSILITLCDNALNSLDNSIESVGYLTSTMIDWFKSTVKLSRASTITLRSQLETYSTSINSLLSKTSQEDQLKLSIEQKKLNYETQTIALQKLEESLLSLKKDIDDTIIDNMNQINRKRAQNSATLEAISVLEKELKDIQDWTDEYDIRQQKNLVEQAELKVERTKNSKDKYQIIAEFNGRIRSNDIVEWEQYKLDDKKYMVIENPNLVELELQVSQIDIVKIKEKDPVIVTFDSYPNKPINAKISYRSVNPEPNGKWWVYYKSTIVIEKQKLEILAWMTAIVDIITDEAKWVILVPTLSLVQKWDKTQVYKKEWEKYNLAEIKVGIQNNFQAQVLIWLVEWDKIRSSVLDDKALKEMWIDEWSANPFGN